MELLLRTTDSALECVDDMGTLRWTLPIEALVLIAEYTTAEGPMVDDYFLIFVTVETGKFFFATCSFYANSRDEVLATLQKQLQSSFALDLSASTDWKSRVVWPSEIAGKEYFTVTEVIPQKLSQKVKKALLGPDGEYAISRTVREYLQSLLTSRT